MKTVIITQNDSNEIKVTTKNPWHCNTPESILNDENILHQSIISLEQPAGILTKLIIYGASIEITSCGSSWTGIKHVSDIRTSSVLDITQGVPSIRARSLRHSAITWPVKWLLKVSQDAFSCVSDTTRNPDLLKGDIYMITVADNAEVLCALDTSR